MQTMIIIILSALSLAALLAAFIFIRGLFPVRVQKVQEILEANWKRSFWIGLVNTILISIFAFGLGSLGGDFALFYVPAFAIYGAFLIGLLFGLAAFSRLLGERLFPESSALQQDLRGGAVFLLASLLPVVGWFLLFPYGICLGVGAVMIAIFQRRSKQQDDDQE